MESSKQPYSPPALTELTRDLAIQLMAKRKKCTQEEGEKLLDSLHKQPPQDATDRKLKRSA